MIKWLFKYGAILYLFNTLLLAIEPTFGLGYSIFLGIMTLYAILLLIDPQQFKIVVLHKAFDFLFILNILKI